MISTKESSPEIPNGCEKCSIIVNGVSNNDIEIPVFGMQPTLVFLEHLADKDSRSVLIPEWIKPDIFEAMWTEFKKRREWKGEGKAQELLEVYNKVNNTEFGM